MDETEAAKMTIINPVAFGVLAGITGAALVAYCAIFVAYWRHRADPLVRSLFSFLYLLHAAANVSFLVANSIVGLPRHWPSQWSKFQNLNETHWTETIEMAMVVILVAQMFGVALMAIERFFGTFDWLSFLHEMFERLPKFIWVIISCLLPVACILPLFYADPPFYYYDDTQEMISLYTMHHGSIQTQYIGPAIIISCAVTALCYAPVLIRDVMVCRQVKRTHRHRMEDDERMTALGFMLLFPQIAGAIFALMGRHAKAEEDIELALWIKGHLAYVQYALAALSPLLIFLSRRARGLLFSRPSISIYPSPSCDSQSTVVKI
ncbi:hypothetical protein PMAYCL1PPCAC_17335 [Pristionchus mayeri]|uniref:G protein-coupled receptor n=1 Tax=Pristionchus mayeri TaxID=1317129 RepID=A0AAN5CMP3_9BILA|nr:hypothetical protein PMAYCL1PPCAC_17335 [Pristionchus mayeri]